MIERRRDAACRMAQQFEIIEAGAEPREGASVLFARRSLSLARV
jgi:hypothetical protein